MSLVLAVVLENTRNVVGPRPIPWRPEPTILTERTRWQRKNAKAKWFGNAIFWGDSMSRLTVSDIQLYELTEVSIFARLSYQE